MTTRRAGITAGTCTGIRAVAGRRPARGAGPPGPGAGHRPGPGRRRRADRAVLATGHSDLEPTAEQRALAAHAGRHPGLRYLRPSIAADMPLDELPAGEVVAARGLGLMFYDVAACLTTGRGGRF